MLLQNTATNCAKSLRPCAFRVAIVFAIEIYRGYLMKLLSILLAVFLFAFVGVAVAQDEGDTLVQAIANDIENFNTVTQSLATSSFAQAYVFPLLYDIDIDTGLPLDTGLTTWT